MDAVATKRMFVGGEWVEGSTAESLPVVNPATGETIAETPRASDEDRKSVV